MIRVRCQRKDGKIYSLSINGHANSAPSGQDLVCAAVSAVVFGGLNALENPKSFEIKTNEKEGNVIVNALECVSNHDYEVLNVIMIQLESIAETNGQYIQIEKGC